MFKTVGVDKNNKELLGQDVDEGGGGFFLKPRRYFRRTTNTEVWLVGRLVNNMNFYSVMIFLSNRYRNIL